MSAAWESPAIATPDALQEPVVSYPPTGDCLFVGISWRFDEACQKRLHQRIREREERLLGEFHTPNLTDYPVEGRSDSLLSCIDSAFAAGEFLLDCLSNESAGI